MPINIGQNPLPFPNLANDEYCNEMGEVPEEMLRMRCDPFIRLVSIPTKSFMVKRCVNPCAPQDSLDRALTACYDQHRQWWVPKPGVTMQCETYRLFPFGRAQSRLCRLQCLPDHPFDQPCPTQTQRCVNHEPYRNHNSHLNCHLCGPHISNTAHGYGPTTDGVYNNC